MLRFGGRSGYGADHGRDVNHARLPVRAGYTKPPRPSESNLVRALLRLLLLVLPVPFAAPLLAAAPPHVVAITGATLVHPEREGRDALQPDAVVVIENDHIKAVGPAGQVKIPKDATRLDAQGKYVLPGLVDAHVHFFQSGNLYPRPDAADFNAVMPYAAEVKRNQARLPATFKVWLASGVTGVVDIGGPMWNFDMRDAARKAELAPHVAVGGPPSLTTPPRQ